MYDDYIGMRAFGKCSSSINHDVEKKKTRGPPVVSLRRRRRRHVAPCDLIKIICAKKKNAPGRRFQYNEYTACTEYGLFNVRRNRNK